MDDITISPIGLVSPDITSKLFILLSQETHYMLQTHEEAMIQSKQQPETSERISKSKNTMALLAFHDHQPVGFCAGTSGIFSRNKATMTFIIGVLKEYWGTGIAAVLTDNFCQEAKVRGIHRIELTVQTENHRAITFYRKYKFKQEGIRKESLLIQNEWKSEIYMSKILS